MPPPPTRAPLPPLHPKVRHPARSEPGDIGDTGLFWLFLSYGYVLFFASNLISEGSELLLLVPSIAGIVGSCVLPVLGAVPDGAIMLFSGLGDVEEAQENLAVGVGALAGSTIMLLTVPWALSLWAGRVDLDGDGRANYARRPKLGKDRGFSECGVSPGPQVRSGAKIMLLTLLSYLIIQGPAFFMSGESRAEVAANEKSWALLGLITTLGGFFAYLWYQVKSSHAQDVQAKKQEAVMKTMLESGQVSLAGAMAGLVYASHDPLAGGNEGGYGTNQLDQDVKAKISEVVRPFFRKFDASGDGHLDKGEIKAVFHDLGEEPSPSRLDEIFDELDHDKNGTIDFDEFVTGIWSHVHRRSHESEGSRVVGEAIKRSGSHTEEDEEEEEVPEDIKDLAPAEQQRVIKSRAAKLLVLGTALVVVFSDPMVDVMSEIGVRTGIPAFYVSFLLAPLASNASELLASMYYAGKKTQTSITISFAALEGAACMNNTFCLAIFMGLIYFKGIAWQYTAETLAIVVVQCAVAVFAMKPTMTPVDACFIMAIYPLSVFLVAGLGAAGFD